MCTIHIYNSPNIYIEMTENIVLFLRNYYFECERRSSFCQWLWFMIQAWKFPKRPNNKRFCRLPPSAIAIVHWRWRCCERWVSLCGVFGWYARSIRKAAFCALATFPQHSRGYLCPWMREEKGAKARARARAASRYWTILMVYVSILCCSHNYRNRMLWFIVCGQAKRMSMVLLDGFNHCPSYILATYLLNLT